MAGELERKLTTILAADAENFSGRMGMDEVGTYGALHQARDVFAKFITRHRGRIANTAGDGLIAEFPSVIEAVNCAIEVQKELKVDDPAALRFRIGLHLGDVIVDGQDLLGEGVNLAARLQSMAEPGGILLSQQVYDQVRSKLRVGFEPLGTTRPKNMEDEVPVYRVSAPGLPDPLHSLAPQVKVPARTLIEERRAQPAPPSPAQDEACDNLASYAKKTGTGLAAITVIDLIFGPNFFVHWVALAAAMDVGWRAMPMLPRTKDDPKLWRGGLLVGALVMINLFTMPAPPWALIPAAAFGVTLLWKKRRSKA
ncbi:adenylate/guanylate cyclase domain-containing protein [Thalassococcus sp. S3]|uniref:adenylate/guanylate cyclase domain-containing protein n=1 Tax=Thalassococcus sp. S3 TaxID=2017482 RepID=UPI0020C42456|nr:adenylate/guanylate cyclase domain-containing protein [Thalassococcus sp. S3]